MKNCRSTGYPVIKSGEKSGSVQEKSGSGPVALKDF